MDHKKYNDVVTRTLHDSERAIYTTETQTPLVIEPKQSKSLAFLQGFMKENSPKIISDIEKHGAVLFRGFDVHLPADFEKQVLSINGMHGINEIMMSELGRTVVDGTRYVMHTNKRFKTGGTLDPVGGVHCENYYSPDVPRFISFFCEKPPLFGGETGLFNIRNIYRELPEDLQEKLEGKSYLVNSFNLLKVSDRYNLKPGQAEDFFKRMGMPIIDHKEDEYALMYKPSVIEHPTTKEKLLLINFSIELNRHNFRKLLEKEFARDYSSLKWFLHKIIWKIPYANLIISGLNHPVITLERYLYESKFAKCLIKSPYAEFPYKEGKDFRIGNEFEVNDIKLIAKNMRRYHSSFRWKKGDFIIIDNLTLAHAGMPGFGSRCIRALMCNPISLTYSKDAVGLYKPDKNENAETWGARLAKQGESLNSPFHVALTS